MKFAIEIKETLMKTVVVEADDLSEAMHRVENAYYDGTIVLNADNALVDVEFAEMR